MQTKRLLAPNADSGTENSVRYPSLHSISKQLVLLGQTLDRDTYTQKLFLTYNNSTLPIPLWTWAF